MSAGIVVYKNRVRINYFPWWVMRKNKAKVWSGAVERPRPSVSVNWNPRCSQSENLAALRSECDNMYQRMETEKSNNSSLSDQSITKSDALFSESGSDVGPSFFLLYFFCVPSSWSWSWSCRPASFVLWLPPQIPHSQACAAWNLVNSLSHTQRLQSATLMFHTSRIKLIELILVSWKDCRRQARLPRLPKPSIYLFSA